MNRYPFYAFRSLLLLFAVVLFLPSCQVSPGTQRVAIASPGSVVTTSDGWRLSFDRFLLVVGSIEAEPEYVERWYGMESSDLVASTVSGAYLYDLAGGERLHPVAQASAQPGRYARIRYTIGPAPGLAPGNVTREEADWMSEKGYSVYLEGVATRGEELRRFAWGMETSTHFHCYDRSNLVLRQDDLLRPKPTVLAITLQRAFGAESGFSFGPIAGADLDGDSRVTEEEMRSVSLERGLAWDVLKSRAEHLGGVNQGIACTVASSPIKGGKRVG